MTAMETHFLKTTGTVRDLARTDFTTLYEGLNVAETLEITRKCSVEEKIVYFYVTDSHMKLLGVVPTRKLLSAAPETLLRDLMLKRLVTIPAAASVLEACEYFVLYKFLAFPVVDEAGRIVGVVDVGQFTEELFDLAAREQSDAVFETLGFRIAQVREAGPGKAFRFRFPWLTATIASGTACAILSGFFGATLEKNITIAFYMPLVLALGESVSMQTMTVAIQALRAIRPTRVRFLRALRRELAAGALLATGCGSLVFLIVFLWTGLFAPAAVIGGSVALAVMFACVLGLSIPWLLHAAKLDPRIAAGPMTLAFTDLAAVLAYLLIARAALP
jgi:magnesium transporter